MKKRQKVIGLVIFSGACDPGPDVEGAIAALRRHGFEAVRMPEKFRPLMHLPKDDFAEVSKVADLSSGDYWKLTADERKIVLAIMEEAEAIANRYGGSADSFGPARPGEQPFEQVFGELVNDDAKLAAEIDKIETEMRIAVERAQAWGRLG